jgi:hypothetical protein
MARPHTITIRTRSLQLAALLAANACAFWFLVTPASSQQVIRPGDLRARGEYTMVAGKTSSGGSTDTVYIVDSANQEVVALRWDQTKKILNGVGYRSIQADARGARGR